MELKAALVVGELEGVGLLRHAAAGDGDRLVGVGGSERGHLPGALGGHGVEGVVGLHVHGVPLGGSRGAGTLTAEHVGLGDPVVPDNRGADLLPGAKARVPEDAHGAGLSEEGVGQVLAERLGLSVAGAGEGDQRLGASGSEDGGHLLRAHLHRGVDDEVGGDGGEEGRGHHVGLVDVSLVEDGLGERVALVLPLVLVGRVGVLAEELQAALDVVGAEGDVALRGTGCCGHEVRVPERCDRCKSAPPEQDLWGGFAHPQPWRLPPHR